MDLGKLTKYLDFKESKEENIYNLFFYDTNFCYEQIKLQLKIENETNSLGIFNEENFNVEFFKNCQNPNLNYVFFDINLSKEHLSLLNHIFKKTANLLCFVFEKFSSETFFKFISFLKLFLEIGLNYNDLFAISLFDEKFKTEQAFQLLCKNYKSNYLIN